MNHVQEWLEAGYGQQLSDLEAQRVRRSALLNHTRQSPGLGGMPITMRAARGDGVVRIMVSRVTGGGRL
jgi:hypothetical protein